MRIAQHALHLVGIGRSEELDIAIFQRQPHFNSFEFPRRLIGSEPLPVASYRLLQLWRQARGVLHFDPLELLRVPANVQALTRVAVCTPSPPYCIPCQELGSRCSN